MWKMDKYLPHVNSLRKLGLSNLLGTCFRIGLHYPLHLHFKNLLERRSKGSGAVKTGLRRRKRQTQSWACLLASPGVPMKWRWIILEPSPRFLVSDQLHDPHQPIQKTLPDEATNLSSLTYPHRLIKRHCCWHTQHDKQWCGDNSLVKILSYCYNHPLAPSCR